jgi:hypothetical protein
MSIAGFFSESIEFRLPHPALDDSILLIAHNAICRALDLLRNHPPNGFSLATAHENAITQQLEWILENRLRKSGEVPGFDERVFHKVRRGPEVTNFNGQHPSKKPDLVFDLARDEPLVLSTLDALFVECKIVDDPRSITANYCNLGLSRFINGDYAWAMQEGMMLAYTRQEHTLSASLCSVMAHDPLYTALGLPSELALVPNCQSYTYAELLHVTCHQRAFYWPDGKGPAGLIRIFHSWHNCS